MRHETRTAFFPYHRAESGGGVNKLVARLSSFYISTSLSSLPPSGGHRITGLRRRRSRNHTTTIVTHSAASTCISGPLGSHMFPTTPITHHPNHPQPPWAGAHRLISRLQAFTNTHFSYILYVAIGDRAQYGARPARAGQSKRECVFASVHARPIHIPSPLCCDSPIVLRSPHCVVIPLCSRHQTRHWSRLPSRHQTALGWIVLGILAERVIDLLVRIVCTNRSEACFSGMLRGCLSHLAWQ